MTHELVCVYFKRRALSLFCFFSFFKDSVVAAAQNKDFGMIQGVNLRPKIGDRLFKLLVCLLEFTILKFQILKH